MTDAPSRQPNVVRTPKSFFQKERDQFYSDWQSSFWRELFQNSTDSGSTRIDIEVEDAFARGSFGRLPTSSSKRPRVVFRDDGCGMNKDLLNDVYFSVGSSSKTDETTVGGFGRARLMTCFSNERYAVHTLDRVVEGDGAEYWNSSREEMLVEMGRWLDVAREAEVSAGGADDGIAAGHALRLGEDVERIRTSPPVLKGCRIEVDLDNTQSYDRATVERMLSKLDTYLEQSDVKCAVTINGKEYVKPKFKIEGRRNLIATIPAREVPDAWRGPSSKVKATLRPDGLWDVAFGRLMVGTGSGLPDSCKGQITVRVNGATMFTQSPGGVEAAVFVEIAPALARHVLTSNRDGLKSDYKRALDDLTALLSTDSQKALKGDTPDEFLVLRGGKGSKTGRVKAKDFDPTMPIDKAARSGGSGSARKELGDRIENEQTSVYFSDYHWHSFLKNEHDPLERDDVLSFMSKLEKKSSVVGTFLESYRDRSHAEGMLVTLRNSGPKSALTHASGGLLGYISDNLRMLRHLEEDRQKAHDSDRLSDLNDIPILKENVLPPADRFTSDEVKARRAKIGSAIRRHDPRNWDKETGKGLLPRKVLAAWNVAVDHCVDTLFEIMPDTKPFTYNCGWLFSHPQWSYDSLRRKDGWRETRAMAMTQKGGGDGTKTLAFLLNPLDSKSDFKNLFSPSDPDDRDSLITTAAHEVAHALVQGHNDAYAYLFTDMCERLTSKRRRVIHADIDRACRMVDRLYAEGKTRVVPLDDEPGVRPGERLMQGLTDSVRDDAVVADGNGTVYDNDVVNAREAEMVRRALEPERDETSEYGSRGP